MQVFKDFLVWAWPGHGFGKEIQEKALPELASRPSSAEQSEQHPDSQASQAASQARAYPLAFFHFSNFN